MQFSILFVLFSVSCILFFSPGCGSNSLGDFKSAGYFRKVSNRVGLRKARSGEFNFCRLDGENVHNLPWESDLQLHPFGIIFIFIIVVVFV
jgi:hypothetical protein